MSTDSSHEGPLDDCEHVLERVYQFLDNELDDASGDAIRQHLSDCEPCLDTFDVEQAVKSLVHRCCGNETAPTHLRAKIITQMTMIRQSS